MQEVIYNPDQDVEVTMYVTGGFAISQSAVDEYSTAQYLSKYSSDLLVTKTMADGRK